MKFIVNTNSLISAASLGIISNNVNRFDNKSTIVQVSVEEDYLVLTSESSMICSEIRLVGQSIPSETDSEPEEKFVRLVDALLFKQLVLSLDTEETEFVFINNGLEVYSGKSKFVLPQVVDSEEIMFKSPEHPNEIDKELEFNKDDWDYIKDNQLYALSKVFTRPVYTYVYVGEDGNVIAGDMDNALFTLSHKLNLNRTCLLSDKIINLFNAIPSGAKLVEHGKGFIMTFDNESFTYRTQFEPKYEDESDIGFYSADLFLSMMVLPQSGFCSLESSIVNKFISQISLFSTLPDEEVRFSIQDNQLTIINKEANKSTISLGGDCENFDISFRVTAIKEVLANYGGEEIYLGPLKNSEGEISGILVWDNDLITMLAGVER